MGLWEPFLWRSRNKVQWNWGAKIRYPKNTKGPTWHPVTMHVWEFAFQLRPQAGHDTMFCGTVFISAQWWTWWVTDFDWSPTLPYVMIIFPLPGLPGLLLYCGQMLVRIKTRMWRACSNRAKHHIQESGPHPRLHNIYQLPWHVSLMRKRSAISMLVAVLFLQYWPYCWLQLHQKSLGFLSVPLRSKLQDSKAPADGASYFPTVHESPCLRTKPS